ncbi:MAG: cytochrome c-type biogenesis protein CcmH [Chloroflexi bacterium]|nr:cytochrome c-type biogenesis protein CcmH [Chloroflexota bacterium]
MTRWLLPIALGGALALAALVAVGLVARDGSGDAAGRADALARELRCPDCQGLSVADSPTESAREIRRQIDDLVADGLSDDEVRAHFVARYGEWILLAPTSPLAWIAPFAVVVSAGLGLGAWLWRSRRNVGAAAPVGGVSADERRRLHEEAEALDG